MKSRNLRFSLVKTKDFFIKGLTVIAIFFSTQSYVKAQSNTVVDIIVGSPDHDSLETAVIAAGLVEALSGEGPFTVFAPTDAAFDALGADTWNALTADPTGTLSTILQYHVASGDVRAGDLTDGQIVTMLEGTDAFITLDGGAFINQATIATTDIVADNGVVHVIDAVITQPSSIVDIVVNSPRHNTLETAVVEAELAGALSAEGSFTLFAPTDAAFDALGTETINALLADPTGDLANILQYHVVGASAFAGDLSDGDSFTTLEGSDISVTINDDGVFINDAQVIFADYEAPNGVVHIIDAVITPPVTTVVDIIVESTVHDSLETAVIAAGLVEALSGEGPFTVFAPTDAAFDALGADTWNTLTADPTGTLSTILQYHVVSGKVMDTDLSDGQIVNMLEGTDSFISLLEDAYINQAKITQTNIEADNGVVHVIDAVITQPASIVDIVVNSPRHNTLETAVVEAELAGPLSAEGSFTLFAPTDAAFDALGSETINALLADPTGDLADILQYHVVGATAFSGDLSDGDMFTTLEGSDISVAINDDGVFINDAQVFFADYEAPNGVVHIIDAVITPETTGFSNRMASGIEARIFPNPAREGFRVSFEMGNSSNVSMDLYNMQGQIIGTRNFGFMSKGLNEIEYRTDSMEDGIYIIIVNTEEGTFMDKVRIVK